MFTVTETNRAMWGTHQGRSLATWNIVRAEGQVVGHGTSYAEYDDRGLLVAMTGFFAR
jgi:hypothetical protein